MGLGISIAVDGRPDAGLADARLVEVDERIGQATLFRLHYGIDIADGDLPMLTDTRLDPGSGLSVLLSTDAGRHCLVKGPVTGQRIQLQHGGAGSTLVVEGADTSVTMDREAKSRIWSGVSDSDAVRSILGEYGYLPDLDTTDARHDEDKHALVQRGPDLAFVRRLAARNGFLFWISCDGTGIETAHFKRPPLDGQAAAELTVNLDGANTSRLDIAWDLECPTSVEAMQLDLAALGDIDGAVASTPQTLLGDRGAAAITGDTRSRQLSAPVDDAGDLRARAEGALIEADWFIRAAASTTLGALGAPVRAHTLVRVRGAGRRHSGLYLVAGVHHGIDATQHRMDIELVRNAWGA